MASLSDDRTLRFVHGVIALLCLPLPLERLVMGESSVTPLSWPEVLVISVLGVWALAGVVSPRIGPGAVLAQ